MLHHLGSLKWLPFGLLAFIFALGAPLDLMEVDAAGYGSISYQMFSTGEYLEVKNHQYDYLDKPPLLFWTSSAMYHLFGVNNAAHKLTTILAFFLGLFATYRLAGKYHGEQVGYLAALVLGSMLGSVLMVNDVRCDALLMIFTITATWQFDAYFTHRRWGALLGGSLAIGLAMLSKGPIGLIVPLFALLPHLLLTGQPRKLLDARLLLAVPLIALVLLPMCIGLHRQFGTDGLKFYFWTQSFGRITGENKWEDDSSIFFFTHTLLWVALPWTLPMLQGWWRGLRELLPGTANRTELLSISGATLGFVSMSMSHYKLPHYIYICLPFLAILTARALVETPKRWHAWSLVALCGIVLFGGILLGVLSFPEEARWPLLVAVVLLLGAMALWRRSTGATRAVLPAFLVMSGAYFITNGIFYPGLLKYQANAQAGRILAERHVPLTDLLTFNTGGPALDYYGRGTVYWTYTVEELEQHIRPGLWTYTGPAEYEALLAAGITPREVIPIPNYKVQALSADFLIPSLRPSVVDTNRLVRF